LTVTKRKEPPKELVKPNLIKTNYFASPVDSEEEDDDQKSKKKIKLKEV
jgi:hypothetical protein